MDENDISMWLGKPDITSPSRSHLLQEARTIEDVVIEDTNSPQLSPSSDAIEVLDRRDSQNTPSSQASDIEAIWEPNARNATERKTSRIDNSNLLVVVPQISDEERYKYKFITGHSSVKAVLSELGDGKFVVRLDSGEIEVVSGDKLGNLNNGTEAYQAYRLHNSSGEKRTLRKPTNSNMVDWSTFDFSDVDGSETSQAGRQKRSHNYEDLSVDELADENSQDDEADLTDDSQPARRSSRRLAGNKRKSHYIDELEQLDDLEDASPKRRRGPGGRLQRTRHTNLVAEPARRSERTRVLPKRSMRERNEDEISSAASEDEKGPKIVAAKEEFFKLPENDPFRKRHRNDCDTCDYAGDLRDKGPLVFCQGCTSSYHKSCLGYRGSREHLVTKIADRIFVLQCRKCIGTNREKDGLAPHLGHCTACNEPGTNAIPFRTRLTTRQEQLQREENGGTDPIVSVPQNIINNINAVMFRCAQCSRAWHMHHLPERKTIQSHDNEEKDEDLSVDQLAQRRFDHYHRSWICKDCIENRNQIDAIVAWRPVDIEGYVPGTTVDMLTEVEKEYLIKWRGQSHLRVDWMPASWVWGVAAGAMRLAYLKKEENALPKMNTKDAIPEEFFRVDIVFDVRYTSVVRNSSKDIDLVRVKEVESAFVKYKGLGYEDAIWEKPPTYAETERWQDFKSAYEDYVAKVYMNNPSKSTLSRHLAAIRGSDFERLARQAQPATLTGGQLMQYQLEGLNWLYWQWFRSHNAILADEMGLGKTIQLVAFFATLIQEHKCWPFLVVVPNSTCPNWRREIKKWAPSLRVVMYYGSERARKLTHDYELFPKDQEKEKDTDKSHHKRRPEVKDIRAHIVVASYESIVEEKTRKSLLRVPWQGLVVDEGQRLKNDKNLVYESLSKISFPFKVLLTGTPLQNNPRELFNLLQFLDKSKNAAELEAKYAELTPENVPELHELLRPFFLRRTKVQVLTFLPPMAQIIVPITMSTVQKRVCKSILSQNPHLMKSIFSRDSLGQKDRFNLNNILMQLRKTLCHPFVYNREIEERTGDQEAAHRGLVEASSKLQLLQLMLPKLKERGHRVLMFSQFLDNLDVMEDFLDGLGLLHRRLDGSINALEKQKRIDEYNAPDSPYFAFLLSTRAGGVGINLATADTVIILDPDFNPHQDIQALSRAHRIGQQNKVLVFQLMTKNTAEEKIMAIGKKKMALDHVLIERMDQEDDAGENLESILKFGANALFEDQNDDDIHYDSASIDKLLDRSQMESTKVSEDKSAESQFSFARIWANDRGTLEDELQDRDVNTIAPNSDIWDKILKEREDAYREEQARKAETFGRGKRRRGQVDYNVNDAANGSAMKSKTVDDDFDITDPENDEDSDHEQAVSSEEELTPVKTIKARPFRRVKVPLGQAPHFNGEGTSEYLPIGGLPPSHPCSACSEWHPMGWCRLKVAGVEHCGLCGLAHMGHGRTCPHLNNEQSVEALLASLKESTEGKDVKDEAIKYLRLIRSDLVSRRRMNEKNAQEMEARNNAAARAGMINTFRDATKAFADVSGIANSIATRNPNSAGANPYTTPGNHQYRNAARPNVLQATPGANGVGNPTANGNQHGHNIGNSNGNANANGNRNRNPNPYGPPRTQGWSMY